MVYSMSQLFEKEKYDITREEWLEKGDEELSQEELEERSRFFQHLLGLCDYAIQPVKSDKGRAIPVSPRFFIIKANCERVLLHEMLHILLLKRDWLKERMPFTPEDSDKMVEELWDKLTERIVFMLTNCILRLKYGGEENIT